MCLNKSIISLIKLRKKYEPHTHLCKHKYNKIINKIFNLKIGELKNYIFIYKLLCSLLIH